VLGVHVRRTEPCAPYAVFGRKRTCDPLAAYVPHVKALSARYGYRALYLVADSVGVLDNASAAFAPMRVLVRADARDAARRAAAARREDAAEAVRRRLARGAGRGRGRAGAPRQTLDPASRVGTERATFPALPSSAAADTHERVLDFLLDALLLGECDGLVGKFSSHLSRAAYSLMATRHGVDCLRPFVSLDVPWCFGLACRKEGDELLKSAWSSERKTLEGRTTRGARSR
jgi:hypothetical protein